MNVLSFTNNQLPITEKQEVAALMQAYQLERCEWPVSQVTYFENLIDQMNGDVGVLFELAMINCHVVGYAFLEYRTNEINDTSYGTLRIFIHPDHRRKGIASRLIHSLMDHVPEQIATFRISIREDQSINNVVMTKLGEPQFKIRLNLSMIRQLEYDWLEEEIRSRKRKLEKHGYQFTYLAHDNYPLGDEGYAKLMEEIWNENTGKKTSKKREEFPISRLNGRYQFVRDQQGTIHTTAVTHGDDWVGLTEIFVYDTNPLLGEQSLTGVTKDHRHQGLGYLLKLMNILEVLNRTEVTHVLTSNADLNEGILKINDKLGFRPSIIYNIYETNKEQLRQYLRTNQHQ